jgi:hypothetical protein
MAGSRTNSGLPRDHASHATNFALAIPELPTPPQFVSALSGFQPPVRSRVRPEGASGLQLEYPAPESNGQFREIRKPVPLCSE